MSVAFPGGVLDGHEFWIFRENKNDVPWGTTKFKQETKIDLKEHRQQEFSNVFELARLILRRCRVSYVSSEERTLPAEPAIIHIATSIQHTEVNTGALYEVAKMQFENKDYVKALDSYNEIANASPTDLNALCQKGIILVILKRFEEAELEFSSALYLNNRIPELWANKALTQHYLGLNREALSSINMAIALASNNRYISYDKAIILFSLGDFKGAREWFDKVLSIDNNSSNAISGKASALSKLGQKEEAYELLYEAIEKDSKNQNAWYNLGVMCRLTLFLQLNAVMVIMLVVQDASVYM